MSTNTSTTVYPEFDRRFANAMLKMLGAVITFMNWAKSKKAILEISDPSAHVAGLELLRDAIKSAVERPIPETVFRFGVAEAETENERDNTVTLEITGNAEWLQKMLPNVGLLSAALADNTNVVNGEQVCTELASALTAVHGGESYHGEVVRVTRREAQS